MIAFFETLSLLEDKKALEEYAHDFLADVQSEVPDDERRFTDKEILDALMSGNVSALSDSRELDALEAAVLNSANDVFAVDLDSQMPGTPDGIVIQQCCGVYWEFDQSFGTYGFGFDLPLGEYIELLREFNEDQLDEITIDDSDEKAVAWLEFIRDERTNKGSDS